MKKKDELEECMRKWNSYFVGNPNWNTLKACAILAHRNELDRRTRTSIFEELARHTADNGKKMSKLDIKISKKYCTCSGCALYGICPSFGYRFRKGEIK